MTQYEELSSSLSDLLAKKEYQKAIAEFNLIKDNLHLDKLKVIKGGYSRTIISTKNGYWMSLINWDSGIKTAIHGHPDTAFVYIIKGEIINVPYEKPLQQKPHKVYHSGGYFYSNYNNGKFDNAIHQLVTTTNTISLHFYSDDARKGNLYSENDLDMA